MEQPRQLRKKSRNCATHSVILVISVRRVTFAIATSARITSAYFARILLCIVIVQGLQYITLLTVLVFIE